MQAIVLVGGEGTRLRPLTYATPKPMVPILGVPFLARTMHRLRDAGIRDVILPAGYMPQAIVDYFGDGAELGMHITYVIEASPLGTAGAIKNVAQYIDGPFLVLNGDILTDLDLRAMIAEHERGGGIGLLHLVRVEDPSAFGLVQHDADGRVTAFIEKPPEGTATTNEINAGTYLFEPQILDEIPAGRNVSIEKEIFPKVVEHDRLGSLTTDDYWMDLGTPKHYLDAHVDILAGRMRIGDVQPPISHNVYIEPGASIDMTAEVGPNVVIGSGSRIGPRAVVSDSVLWRDVVVEEDAHVCGAILANGATIGAATKVEEGSVVGTDVSIGAGAVVGKGSRIWVHAHAG